MTVSAVTGRAEYEEPPGPAFLFDLDGTLIDSVYQNVIAWRNALSRLDIDLSVWRIHRRIGMSGGLFVSALLRETGRSLSDDDIEALQQDHAAQYLTQVDSVRALPGACDLLAALTAAALIQPNSLPGEDPERPARVTYRMHPGIAQAIRADAPGVQAATDTGLAATWQQLSDQARQREGGEADQ